MTEPALSVRRRGRSRLVPYLYVLPAAIVLGVFFFGSFAQVIIYSFGSYNPFTDEFTPVGLANYAALLEDDRFLSTLLNSFLYLLVTPALIVLSLACALVVDARIRGAGLLRLLFFLPVVTPTIVAAIAWRILLREDDGLLNAGLRAIGLDGVAWLTEPPWTLISPMLVTCWKGFGFYMMIFLAGLLAVPTELKEAAALDGAGRLGVFRHVVLPAIRPLLVLVVIISSISALKVFDELYVTVQGVPIGQQTAVPFVYHEAFTRGDFGYASAAAVVLFCCILAFSVVNLRISGGRS